MSFDDFFTWKLLKINLKSGLSFPVAFNLFALKIALVQANE
jgi:hypothetical protein